MGNHHGAKVLSGATRLITITAVIAALSPTAALAEIPNVRLDILAMTGGPATDGETFVDVGNVLSETPVLNDRGEALFVAFTGTLQQPITGLYFADKDRTAKNRQRRQRSYRSGRLAGRPADCAGT